MILIGAKLATNRSKAGDGELLMTRNQRLDVHPTFLLGKNATAAIRASQRPLVMNWIEAVDVHSGANGCFRRRCVDPEVEALGLRSAELGVLA